MDPDGSPDNRYYAPEESWLSACVETNFTAASLDDQIALVNAGLSDVSMGITY
jgi:hypothetical protein